MRSKFTLRPRPVHVAAGAVMLAIPASAFALTAQATVAPSALHFNLDRSQLRNGQQLVATGAAPVADRGQRLTLEFAATGSATWSQLTSTSIDPAGHFRLAANARESGSVRVVGGASAAGASSAKPAGSTAIAPSAPQPVTVSATVDAPTGSTDVLSGQSFDIRGRLLPGEPGRVVKLQAGGTGHGWTTLTTTRTSRAGRFDLRSTAAGTGQQQLRVKFDGDRLNGRASARAGQLTVYRSSVASWYSDGGSTACGFHAGYGVANKTLPCGTKVTFSYQGRTVTAVVDDRGPFVGGREWDLNQNVANALGFNGVDTVWSSL
jgi:rare lipoprotein A